MSAIILDKDQLTSNIRSQMANSSQLKYQRALLEFEDNSGGFLGDNVFETSFLLRENQTPLIYEVSGPYDTVSNEYATVGRIYDSGERIFECNMKDQIQQRTAAMVTLFFDALNHTPKKVLMVGAGKLSTETVGYLKHYYPELETLDYHARSQHADSFEVTCATQGITATFKADLSFTGYDTIVMVTNTAQCLIDLDNIDSVQPNAVVASLCTTSQVGEIAPNVYGHDSVFTIFDYDLTHTFTPDMRAANDAGHLEDVTYLADILNAKTIPGSSDKRIILRITGTPMQNVAVLDMMRLLKE